MPNEFHKCAVHVHVPIYKWYALKFVQEENRNWSRDRDIP